MLILIRSNHNQWFELVAKGRAEGPTSPYFVEELALQNTACCESHPEVVAWVGAWLRCYLGAWVRGCVGAWMRCYLGAWVRGCVGACERASEQAS